MPFLQRVIEPVHVCRNALPLDEQGALAVEVPNELECVTNGTLANIIRQLSSLSKHAEDMFSCLFRESSAIVSRVGALQGRMDRLAVKVTQLDSTIEEVSLQDIHMRKAFKSNVTFDQQIVSRESMPVAMKETYLMCDKPPPLGKLNPYREDGKDGLKFYTDPNYFFDLWKDEMLKDTEKKQQDREKKVVHSKEILEHPSQRVRHEYKKHKKNKTAHASKDKNNQSKPMNIINAANHYQLQYSRTVSRMGNNIQPDGQPVRPNSLELHSSFFNQQQAPYAVNTKSQYPPPPPAYTEHPISPQQHYPPPPYVAASPQRSDISPMSPGRQAGTPKAVFSMRPCQPPPAPPVSNSTSSSGSSTPTASVETPSSGTNRYHRNIPTRNNLPPPPPPPSVIDAQSSSVPSPPSLTAQSPNMLSETPTLKQERYPNNVNGKKVEEIVISSSSSSSSNSSKKNSLETIVKESNIEEPDLPSPPPIPKPNAVAEKIDNVSVEVSIAPVQTRETVVQPPPPPPPPLPPIEDLVLDAVENGSISDNQNIDVISTTSESASETSSLSKMSEQHYDGKLKLSGQEDGRSDLLQAIREGIKLRRVEDHKQKEVEKAAPLHDVASILARRVAMEFSDSDSPSESECDSDGWEEDPEHVKAKQDKTVAN